jgi:F-type H+-transporting ATPase subunit epsilon
VATSNLTVEVVSPDKRVWSGEATMVSARTLDGDIGILPGHSLLLGVLVDGKVEIKVVGGEKIEFTVNGGFLSVSQNRVSVLGQATE